MSVKDVVYSEAEYSILLRKTEEYSTFLSNSIAKYQAILDFLMEKAIHDEQICAKILQLKSDVALYTEQLESIRLETKNTLAKLKEEFEKADKVCLPDLNLLDFKAVFNMFK